MIGGEIWLEEKERLLDDVYGEIPAEDYKKLHDRLSG